MQYTTYPIESGQGGDSNLQSSALQSCALSVLTGIILFCDTDTPFLVREPLSYYRMNFIALTCREERPYQSFFLMLHLVLIKTIFPFLFHDRQILVNFLADWRVKMQYEFSDAGCIHEKLPKKCWDVRWLLKSAIMVESVTCPKSTTLVIFGHLEKIVKTSLVTSRYSILGITECGHRGFRRNRIYHQSLICITRSLQAWMPTRDKKQVHVALGSYSDAGMR